jgi:hypothetical protein
VERGSQTGHLRLELTRFGVSPLTPVFRTNSLRTPSGAARPASARPRRGGSRWTACTRSSRVSQPVPVAVQGPRRRRARVRAAQERIGAVTAARPGPGSGPASRGPDDPRQARLHSRARAAARGLAALAPPRFPLSRVPRAPLLVPRRRERPRRAHTSAQRCPHALLRRLMLPDLRVATRCIGAIHPASVVPTAGRTAGGVISESDGHRTAPGAGKARAAATSPATLRALPTRALHSGCARTHRRGRSRVARPWALERGRRNRPLPHRLGACRFVCRRGRGRRCLRWHPTRTSSLCRRGSARSTLSAIFDVRPPRRSWQRALGSAAAAPSVPHAV